VRVWIGSHPDKSRPSMQQSVILPVLANNQIPIRIVHLVAVNVMNFDAIR
jgi:hypothetical protein